MLVLEGVGIRSQGGMVDLDVELDLLLLGIFLEEGDRLTAAASKSYWCLVPAPEGFGSIQDGAGESRGVGACVRPPEP
jgi:hypothetical protein